MKSEGFYGSYGVLTNATHTQKKKVKESEVSG